MLKHCFAAVVLVLPPLASRCSGQASPLGLFDSHGDIGVVLTPGTAEFDQQRGAYTLSGSGENMWAAADAVQFVWKQVNSGDIALAAEMAFLTSGGNAHRKAILMIRQSLDADSPYCDAALHGDGLTSLQCRERQGGPTFEIRQAIVSARRMRIEKRGSTFTVSAGLEDEPLRFTGGAARLSLDGPFYVGIGVCAHDRNAVERVVFSNVSLSAPEPVAAASTLEVAPVRGDRRAIHVSAGGIESLSWSNDGKSIAFLSGGKAWTVAATGGPAAELAATGAGAPAAMRLFTGKRRGRMHIYSQPAGGGRKTWLTNGPGDDANPRLSSDGSAVFFDSDRAGTRQIWRMSADGAHAEQLTNEAMHSRMPHLSPDGLRVSMLSSESPSSRQVRVRVLTLADKKIAVLAQISGGPGSMDSPPWSPDSRSLAFVSYRD